VQNSNKYVVKPFPFERSLAAFACFVSSLHRKRNGCKKEKILHWPVMRKYILAASLLPLILLPACSDVGIGFAHHPLDCAIGIAWGDCLPGTPGYAHQPHPQPAMVWSKPNLMQQDFARDKYACMMDARAQTSGSSFTGGTMVGNTYLPAAGASRSGEIINQDLFAACMEAKGYTQQQQ